MDLLYDMDGMEIPTSDTVTQKQLAKLMTLKPSNSNFVKATDPTIRIDSSNVVTIDDKNCTT